MTDTPIRAESARSNNPSRRRIIGALLTAPVIVTAPIVFALNNPDAAIIHAWNERQRNLAIIESRGPFYYAETHSPAETEVFDDMENVIFKLPAKTNSGMLAKLWVALSHAGRQV